MKGSVAMNVARIVEILQDSIGKVDEHQAPLTGTEVVDVYHVPVPLDTEKVQRYAVEMTELLRDWPTTSWGHPVPPLGDELSYITVGAVLGDQGCAFMLFAFGLSLDWWDLWDPGTILGIDKDEEAGQLMAGRGLVAIRGYRPSTAHA